MSKDVASLLVVGHAYEIAGAASPERRGTVAHKLRLMRFPDDHETPVAITTEQRNNWLAAEALFEIGHLATEHYLGTEPLPRPDNPYRDEVLDVFGVFLPKGEGRHLLPNGTRQSPLQPLLTIEDYESIFETEIVGDNEENSVAADDEENKLAKTQIAIVRAIAKRRGTVRVPHFNDVAYMRGISSGTIKVGDQHPFVPYSLIPVPYYQAFREAKAPAMLGKALEDLHVLSDALEHAATTMNRNAPLLG